MLKQWGEWGGKERVVEETFLSFYNETQVPEHNKRFSSALSSLRLPVSSESEQAIVFHGELEQKKVTALPLAVTGLLRSIDLFNEL